ncbi:MAG: FkbM family methyltransferase [Lacunisphaera sp.]
MSVTLENELETLLSETREAALQREGSAFDEATGPTTRPIVLFGGGGLGRRTLKGLREIGIEPIAFADNGNTLWGKKIDGVDVLSPVDAASRYGRTAVFVVTIWRAGGTHRFDRTALQLQQLGCACVLHAIHLFWKHPAVFLDFYCLGLPHRVLEQRDAVRKTFKSLADEISRREYVSQIRWRLHADFGGLASPVPQEQYFPEDIFRLTERETFVDCGAFDGDSIEAFVRRQGPAFEEIIALEPDPINFTKMANRVAWYSSDIRTKIQLEKVGAADFAGPLRFDGDGSLSSAANPDGSLEIQCVKLDDLLANHRPTYLKMDIEGAEPDALRGATQTIRNHAPVLAISAYHKQYHLWLIPAQLLAINPDYALYLRPHNEECWDTVCYAVPTARAGSS